MINARYLSCLGLAALITLAGCSRNSPPEPAPAADDGKDYSQLLKNVRERSAQTMVVDRINESIQAFSTELGRQPTNLTELVRFGFIDEIPKAPKGTRFVYDQTNRTLVVAKDPAATVEPEP